MITGHIFKFTKSLSLWTFFSNLSYSSILSLSIQISFAIIIFNVNPRNGHYLYPPFFSNTRVKEEYRGHNSKMWFLFDVETTGSERYKSWPFQKCVSQFCRVEKNQFRWIVLTSITTTKRSWNIEWICLTNYFLFN